MTMCTTSYNISGHWSLAVTLLCTLLLISLSPPLVKGDEAGVMTTGYPYEICLDPFILNTLVATLRRVQTENMMYRLYFGTRTSGCAGQEQGRMRTSGSAETAKQLCDWLRKNDSVLYGQQCLKRSGGSS